MRYAHLGPKHVAEAVEPLIGAAATTGSDAIDVASFEVARVG